MFSATTLAKVSLPLPNFFAERSIAATVMRDGPTAGVDQMQGRVVIRAVGSHPPQPLKSSILVCRYAPEVTG